MSWRQLACAVAMSIAVTGSGISYADDDKDKHDGIDPSRVQQGFDASPIPKDQLNFKGKDPYLVGLGAYLVNAAADCNGCHTFPRFLNPGKPGSNPSVGDPYGDAASETSPSSQSLTGQLKANSNIKHFLAGGRCFGGFMSYNITPDASGRPLGLSEADFFKVMRKGEDVHCEPDHDPSDPICALGTPGANPNVLQTMSWPTYHSMTDTDLKAIYAYLSAIPHAEACNTPADGCAPFSGLAKQNGLASGQYAYTNSDDCPNPPTPQ